MFNVLGIALFSNELMDIRKIIAFVCAHMLVRSGTLYHNMQDQIVQRPFIMQIGSRDPNCQRSTALIDQNMDLAALFGSIGGIIARIAAAQRRWTRTTVHRLPLPQDPFSTAIEIQHRAKDLLPDAFLLPGLKAFVQDTAGDAKPTSMNRLPLTACPQNVPDAIHNSMVRFSGSSGTRWSCLFGKVLFRNAPQLARNTEIVHLLRFYGMLFHDVSRFGLVFDNLIYNRIRHFFQALLFFG
jgi:hypothetical protein